MKVKFQTPLLGLLFCAGLWAQNAAPAPKPEGKQEPKPEAKAILAQASQALGVTNLTSITFAGSAAAVNFGQAPTADGPWQGNLITNYVRAITFDPLASRATGTQLTPPIQGGPPSPQPYNQLIAGDAPWAQALEIYLLPWGFLKGAATGKELRLTTTPSTYDLSYQPPQESPSKAHYRVTAHINRATGMIDSVSTEVEHVLWGDLPVENVYGDYRDFDGTKVPMKMIQKRGGDVVFDANIIGAEPNPNDIRQLMTPPAALPKPAAGPVASRLTSEKLADGVYRITGGYVSMAVEFKDHVMVLEGGQSEVRGLAVIAEVKRLFPAKPIRYLFNTHYHFDHTSGLAPFVAEGATIITQRNNVAYLTRALNGPRKLLGDVLSKSGKKTKFLPVEEKLVLSDEARTIEFHHILDMNHTNGMLIAFLPKEKILFQGDFTLPAPGAQPNEFVVALGENLKRLKLDYDRFVPVHAPSPDVPWTKADVERALNQ